MAVNVAARKLQFRDKDGADYPGFLSLSCGWEAVGAGLVIWTGTAEIAEHPGNGRPIDTRTNRETWFYAQPVSLSVQADSGVFAEPKCLPKMFVANAKFDPTTRRLSLELTCVLGLLKDYTADDFRDKFEEENAVEESPEEKFRVDRCGNPEEGDYDPSKGEANAEKRAREWWRRWEGEGECAISEIVFEVLSRLGCGCSGKVEGKIRLPHSLSGSLLGACGELCRKALKPSYLVSDGRGRALIRRIDLDPPPGKALTLFDVKSFSLNNSAPPISELVVTGQIPELAEDETEDEVEVLEDGTKRYKSVRTTKMPADLISPDYLGTIMDGTRTTTVEEVTPTTKTVTEYTEARYALIFPDSMDGSHSKTKWFVSEAREEKQYFDGCLGRLTKKRIRVWRPWGKIFSEFYKNRGLQVITNPADLLPSSAPSPPFGRGASAGGISELPIFAQFNPFLLMAEETEEAYEYSDATGKLRKVSAATREPKSAIAPTYLEPLDGYATSRLEVEEWKEWGQGHQIHTKEIAESLERKESDRIQEREQFLLEAWFDTATPEYGAITSPSISVEGFNLVNFTHHLSSGIVTYESVERFDTEIAKQFLSPDVRLALTAGETDRDHGRSGTANSPAIEHLPRGEDGGAGEGATEKWEAKTKVWRQKWRLPARGDYLPRREVLNLGDVYSLDYLEVQALLAFQLRQVQSQTYQCAVPLSDDFLTSPFAPARRWDITEPDGAAYAYLATALNFEFSEATCFALAELWLLGPGTGAAYEPPAVTAFTLDYVPPTEAGVFLLDGAAVTGGQTLTPEQFATLTFVPGVSYSGAATLSYAATGGDGQTGATQAIAAVDPSYDPVTVAGQETPPLENGGSVYAGTDGDGNAVYLAPTASVAVSPGSGGIAVAPPTDYESAGLAYTAPRQVESQFQSAEVLRRLRIERDRRLSLTRQERLTKLYR